MFVRVYGDPGNPLNPDALITVIITESSERKRAKASERKEPSANQISPFFARFFRSLARETKNTSSERNDAMRCERAMRARRCWEIKIRGETSADLCREMDRELDEWTVNLTATLSTLVTLIPAVVGWSLSHYPTGYPLPLST